MPRGVPTINSVREELSAPAITAEVLGTINEQSPSDTTVAWEGPSGKLMEMTEPPPPWEIEDTRYAVSDARRFVDVPDSWELRWLNPKIIETMGWRYWQPVMATDPRVKVKVDSMVAPDNNIRRGGADGGDILGWMFKSWVASRRKQLAEVTDRQRDSASNRQSQLREEFRRGTFGPNVSIEEARHPTHTIGEGRSMRD